MKMSDEMIQDLAEHGEVIMRDKMEIEQKATRYDALCELTLMSEDEYNAVMESMGGDDRENSNCIYRIDCNLVDAGSS